MFALVEDGSITKYFSGNRGFTLGSNQYSKQVFTLWSEAERNAIGIYTVEMDTSKRKDEQWYTNTNVSYAFAGGKLPVHMEMQQLNLMQTLYLQHKMKRMD